jgi:hypothetical protein
MEIQSVVIATKRVSWSNIDDNVWLCATDILTGLLNHPNCNNLKFVTAENKIKIDTDFYINEAALFFLLGRSRRVNKMEIMAACSKSISEIKSHRRTIVDVKIDVILQSNRQMLSLLTELIKRDNNKRITYTRTVVRNYKNKIQ